MRNRRLFLWVLLGIGFSVVSGRAQLSEEEKKRLFLQAREDIRPVPKASATPRAKPQPAGTPAPKETPQPTPKATPKATPVRESTPKPSATPEATPEEAPAKPRETPKPRATPEPEEATPSPTPEKPAPTPEKPAPTPREVKGKPAPDSEGDFILLPGDKPGGGKPKPAANAEPEESPKESPVQIPKGKTPGGERLDAPIHVEKSGLEKDLGEEPAPKKQFGGFFKRYRYLTPSVRKAIDSARVQRGRWKYIIIHNSGTRQGNARIFDVYHRRTRKMQNGLAYHFVIGNGNSSGNGEIEIGNRWTRQINGGHVASDYLNNIALGICLVGDLNRDKPTPEQLAAIDELVTYLRGRVGKIKGKQAIVKGHKEINPKPTDCPGDRFPLGWLRQKFR